MAGPLSGYALGQRLISTQRAGGFDDDEQPWGRSYCHGLLEKQAGVLGWACGQMTAEIGQQGYFGGQSSCERHGATGHSHGGHLRARAAITRRAQRAADGASGWTHREGWRDGLPIASLAACFFFASSTRNVKPKRSVKGGRRCETLRKTRRCRSSRPQATQRAGPGLVAAHGEASALSAPEQRPADLTQQRSVY